MKTIVTEPCGNYTVTLTKEATIVGTTNAGTDLVLASSAKAGQVSFQAVSIETRVSDDAAVVLPLHDPAQIPDAFTAEQVAEMIDSAVGAHFRESTKVPPEGAREDLVYFGVSVVAQQDGLLRQIELEPMSSGVGDASPVWLDVWLRRSSSSEWVYGGHSTAAVLQRAAVASVWVFDGIQLGEGDVLHLEAHHAPQDDDHSARLGSRVVRVTGAAGEGAMNEKGNVKLEFQPDYSIVFLVADGVLVRGVPVPLRDDFDDHVANDVVHVTPEERAGWDANVAAHRAHAGDTVMHWSLNDRAAFGSHTGDAVRHVTAAERAAWNAKADASALSGKVNTATFNAHAGDAVKHVTAAEREAWNAAANGNLPGKVTVASLDGAISRFIVKSGADSELRAECVVDQITQSHASLAATDRLAMLTVDGPVAGLDIHSTANKGGNTARFRASALDGNGSILIDNMQLIVTFGDMSLTLDAGKIAALAALLARKDELLALLNPPTPTTES